MPWKRLSITKKLFLAIALTAAIIVAALALMIALTMRVGFSQFLLESELDRFDQVTEALTVAHDFDDPGWPELAASPRRWRDFVHVNMPPPGRPAGLRDPLAATGNSGLPISPQRRPPRRGASADDGNQRRLGQPGWGPTRPPPDPLQLGRHLSLFDAKGQLVAGLEPDSGVSARRPVKRSGGNNETVGWLVLSAPNRRTVTADNLFLRSQFQALLLVSGLAIALSALVAFALARQFLAPVRKLAAAARTLAAGDYGTRIDSERQDEFGDLIGHFNSLARSLEAAEQAERQWLSDASHELQTPISVLRAEIEAVQDGIRQPDDKTLNEMRDSVLRLSSLVADLNVLAQAREGGFALAVSRQNVSELLIQALESGRSGMRSQGLELEARVDPDIVLDCDPVRFRQLCDNLLENARRYTQPPGTVRVTAIADGPDLELVIEDSAPAPPYEVLPKIFDRFFRAESSRVRTLGGSGLGLAICCAIVESHGGSIAAELARMGGLKVTVRLSGGKALDD